jgi:hypothetical protein
MRCAAFFLLLAISCTSTSHPLIAQQSFQSVAITPSATSQSSSSNVIAIATKTDTTNTPTTSSHEGGLKDKLDIIEIIFKIVAYLLGSLWVYFNYFQGRTHRPRLEIKLTGAKLNSPHDGLFKMVAQVKNVGLSKVELKDHGTAIRISGFDSTKITNNWINIGTHAILTPYHQWIEPGETIEDHHTG